MIYWTRVAGRSKCELICGIKIKRYVFLQGLVNIHDQDFPVQLSFVDQTERP